MRGAGGVLREKLGNRWLLYGAASALTLAGCERTESTPTPVSSSAPAAASISASAAPSVPAASASVAPSSSASAGSSAKTAPPAPKGGVNRKLYAWLETPSLGSPPAVDTLLARFPSPPGYERVAVKPGSYGAWLRTLPLAAAGTAVSDWEGNELTPAKWQYLGAVVALDVGRADLQHSTDTMIRLHAEWRWAKGDRGDIAYKAATGLEMPFGRWMKGDRLKPAGAAVRWQRAGRPSENDHGQFREYLEGVFTWSNSTSLFKEAKNVERKDARPGDFLMHDGKPSHAVILLDMARDESGRLVALLGRSLTPAQNMIVLRLGPTEAWFGIDPLKDEQLLTPGTEPFSWNNIKRLD